MKFSKIAKDTTGQVLDIGDILLYSNDGQANIAVIRKIVQRDRNQFPQLEVSVITADWRGQNVRAQHRVLAMETYKKARVSDPASLRSDVPLNKKVLQTRDHVLSQKSKR